MEKPTFRACKWLASALRLPIPNSNTDLHSPGKLRTCVFLAGPPPVQATEQELSHCWSWKSGPRTQAGSFPFSQARFRLGVRGRPLLVELSTRVAGEPLLLGSARLRFDFSAGSAGSLAANSPLAQSSGCILIPISPRAPLFQSACPFPGKTLSGGLGTEPQVWPAFWTPRREAAVSPGTGFAGQQVDGGW